MKKLEGKTALITGGNSGIGLAAAELFLKEGAKVIITGRRPDAVKETVTTLGPGAFGIVSDAGNMADVAALPKKISEVSPKVDVLFVNAGVAFFVPYDQTTEAIFDANLDVNFKGAFFTTQKLLPMINDGGSVVFNTSVLAHLGLAGSAAYSASKAALLSLSKTLAVELATRGIRVNAISPGPTSTPIYGKMGMPEDVLTQFAAEVQKKIPLNRFGQAVEVAQAALFLASDQSRYLTGSEISVDGGKKIAF